MVDQRSLLVLVLGVVGVVDVWLLRVWRWEWGRYDLHLLVVLVCVVRWMLSEALVVWLWEVVLICMHDNSLVVGGLCPRHPVPGSLRFRINVGCAAEVDISSVEGQRHVRPLRLHDWTSDGDVVDASVVVPLLSLRVEVDAGPPSDHVNDSAIRLISEVFLLWTFWWCWYAWLGGC